MTIKIVLAGADGKPIRVFSEGEIGVVQHDHPPAIEKVSGIPFVESFKTTAGATDMKVNGSSTNVVFSVNADVDRDTYIKTISIVIADQNATLNKFGNITALSNGCNLLWQTSDLGATTLRGGMKTNWDFVKLSRGNPSYGDGTTAFRSGNVSGASEGYLFVLDLTAVFGGVRGLRLRKGSKDMLCVVVRDDVTGVDEFTAECTGMKF